MVSVQPISITHHIMETQRLNYGLQLLARKIPMKVKTTTTTKS